MTHLVALCRTARAKKSAIVAQRGGMGSSRRAESHARAQTAAQRIEMNHLLELSRSHGGGAQPGLFSVSTVVSPTAVGIVPRTSAGRFGSRCAAM